MILYVSEEVKAPGEIILSNLSIGMFYLVQKNINSTNLHQSDSQKSFDCFYSVPLPFWNAKLLLFTFNQIYRPLKVIICLLIYLSNLSNFRSIIGWSFQRELKQADEIVPHAASINNYSDSRQSIWKTFGKFGR